MALTETQVKDVAWLGKFVATHSIGYIDLVEFLPNVCKNGLTIGNKYEKESNFAIFVDGKSTSSSAKSLEGALAVAMAYKHEGHNSSAAHYFLKMLGIGK